MDTIREIWSRTAKFASPLFSMATLIGCWYGATHANKAHEACQQALNAGAALYAVGLLLAIGAWIYKRD